ncbi:MAG: glycosyltransferase family 61 protein, partial [Verrucomicrobiota bacterium]|nr:glycosyltransferase family 61 protein [Verrucomicrobiota bacterium]
AGVTSAHGLFDGQSALRTKQIARSASDRSVVRWLIHPGETVELPFPKTIEQNDAGGFAPWRPVHRQPAYVYRFTNGLYHGAHGAVLDHRLRVFEDLADVVPNFFSDAAGIASLRKKHQARLSEGVAVALSSSQNYYHWLLKMLPRLHLVGEAGVDPNSCDALFINKPTAAQAEGYLEAALRPDLLRVIKGDEFWCCRQLYVASIAHDVPAWSVEYLRRLFLATNATEQTASTAIYLRRGNAATRRVRNEDELCNHLGRRGIRAFDLSQHSLREQIQIVSNADLIIAPHGAALANLVFAKKRTRVLEIFANAENQKCYWMVARHRRLIYHYVLAQPLPRGDESNQFDMLVPLEKLNRALDYLERDSETFDL